MARKRGSKMLLDFSDLSTFTDVIERLTKSRTYYSEGGKRRLTELGIEVRQKFINPMLMELGFEPGDSPKGNFKKYATPKQKRWYFAAVRRGEIKTDANGRYIRSHELSGGWRVEVALKFGRRNIIALRAFNLKKYSPFVVGKVSLGVSRQTRVDYMRPQQRFHRITGWLSVSPTIQKYYKQAKDYVDAEMRQWAKDGMP